MCLHHMLLATDGWRSPQALEQLIAFVGDTATVDKVKDKPSVHNSSPASSGQTTVHMPAWCLPELVQHSILYVQVVACVIICLDE